MAHAGFDHSTSTATKDSTAINNSSSNNNTSSGGCNGFKVYGSLFKVDARYQFINPLGKGSYGIVCAAKDRETGLSMAIKKVSPMAKRTVDAKHTLREVLLLQLLGRHPNIISIHNLSTNLKDDELYIVMDLMDTDLHRVIQSSQALSESHVKYFLHQLLRGVKYLHDNGVLHRDLKPGNLLLSKTCQLKIADFGLARKFPKSHQHSSTTGTGITSTLERPRSAPAASSSGSSTSGSSNPGTRPLDRAPMTEHVVTRWYRAPELMLQPDGLYDQSVDMWSVGCIFAEILGRKALFPGKNFLHQLALIFDVLGTPPVEATTRIKSAQAQRFLKSLGKKPKVPFRTIFPTAGDDAADLLEKLLEFDPAKRITAQDALTHPYMQAIEKKYKGVDPHANSRGLDFSFDGNKKLTKLDLRALIVKEVESFRKCVAHTAAIDNEVSEEKLRERASAGSHTIGAKQLPKDKLSQAHQRQTGAMPGASVPGATKDLKTQARVLCGSAGMSMINSLLRQPLTSSQNQEQPQNTQSTGRDVTSTVGSIVTSTGASSAIAIGSNRQRIRTTTKPPVPRQQGLSGGGGLATGALVSNQQENQLQHGRVTIHHSQSGAQLLTEQSDAQSPSRAAVKEQVAPQGFLFTQAPAPEPDSHTITENRLPRSGATADANSNVPDPAKAIAAAIALSERSKALISSLSRPGGTDSTGSSQRLGSTQLFASRTSNVGSSNAGTARNNPECSSSPSSSSPSSSDSDTESRRLRGSLAQSPAANSRVRVQTSRQEVPSDGSGQLGHPPIRRAASAGPTRTRSSLVAASSSNSAAASGTNNSTAAFVGTTNSLIRAQRAGNGQTLTESANQMLATMKRPQQPQDQQYQNSHSEVERDDSVVFAPPVQSSSSSTLKTQRSASQLLPQQLQQLQQQPVGEKKVLKQRLTVPKSPKFSVMSWQKKRGGSGSIRPSSAAAASSTSTTTQTPSTAAAAAMTARK
ncbi:hypothetical protein Gpo141_00004483 [Globisporangium polare]